MWIDAHFEKLWIGFMLYFTLFLLVKVILIKHLPLSLIVQNMEFKINIIQINLIPFKTIYGYIALENIIVSMKNIFGNIFAFLPLGFLLPILIGRLQRLKSLLLVSFCFSLSFEFIQLIIPMLGSFDVDDLILNTFGASLGYLGLSVVKKFALEKKTYNAYH